jgi:hypothetical protein
VGKNSPKITWYAADWVKKNKARATNKSANSLAPSFFKRTKRRAPRKARPVKNSMVPFGAEGIQPK